MVKNIDLEDVRLIDLLSLYCYKHLKYIEVLNIEGNFAKRKVLYSSGSILSIQDIHPKDYNLKVQIVSGYSIYVNPKRKAGKPA